MPQRIFLAHLQSMHKQLDFLVQSALDPLDVREYMMAYELEMIRLQQPDHSDDKPEKDEQTAIYQANTVIQDLSNALDLTPNDPQLWLSRGKLWLKIQDEGAAFSDFTRALQLMHQQKSHDNGTENNWTSIAKQTIKQMTAIHPEYTEHVLKAFQSTLSISETLQ